MLRGLFTALLLVHWLVMPMAGAGMASVASDHVEQSPAATHGAAHAPTDAAHAHAGDASCCDVAGHCASAVPAASIADTATPPRPRFDHTVTVRLAPGIIPRPYRPPSLSS